MNPDWIRDVSVHHVLHNPLVVFVNLVIRSSSYIPIENDSTPLAQFIVGSIIVPCIIKRGG